MNEPTHEELLRARLCPYCRAALMASIRGTNVWYCPENHGKWGLSGPVKPLPAEEKEPEHYEPQATTPMVGGLLWVSVWEESQNPLPTLESAMDKLRDHFDDDSFEGKEGLFWRVINPQGWVVHQSRETRRACVASHGCPDCLGSLQPTGQEELWKCPRCRKEQTISLAS